jgi:hypothetical protein
MDGCLRVLCGIGATLLLILASGALLLFAAQTTPTPAFAATSCPISSLPPTPTSAPPADPSSIRLNEVLSNPKKDWDCDGDTGTKNQWLELANLGATDAALGQLEIFSQNSNNNQPVLLNSSARISAHGFLAIFIAQLSGTLSLFPGGGTLELLDGTTGTIVDTVTYPALGQDQSFARDASGQWNTSTTPTPGASNTSSSTPTPTATHHSGNSGGGGSTPTDTPAPVASIFIPTDTPSTLAFRGPGNSSSSSGNGGTNDTTLPGWLKITLLILMGAGLVAAVIWYIRSWGPEPESGP